LSVETGKRKATSSLALLGACVGLAFIFVSIVSFGLNVLLPWHSLRIGLLYFRIDEALGIFLVVFGILAVTGRNHPEWQLERFFLRLVISLVSISVLWALAEISEREFALLVLKVLSFLMLLWIFFDKYLRATLICVAVLIALLLIPVDVVISSPLHPTEGREASVRWLRAGYGLSIRPDPDVYNLGCIVPPNQLQWVLLIDFWPAVDRAFLSFDEFFNIKVRSTDVH